MTAAPRHPERLYLARDGGGSDRGGLWSSADGGAHLTALAPPLPVVTALAVSADDVPQLAVATFRPAGRAVAIWTYRDAGGRPSGAVAAGCLLAVAAGLTAYARRDRPGTASRIDSQG